MSREPLAWRLLRSLFGMFFLATGATIVLSIATGWPGPPPQPTAAARAFHSALTQSGFIDPLLALTFGVGGAVLLLRSSAPLGLVLLAAPVVVIFFFHLLLSGQWPVGSAVAMIWAALAWHERARLSHLWKLRDRID